MCSCPDSRTLANTQTASLLGLAACASAAAGYKLTNYYSEDELINRINSANDNTWCAQFVPSLSVEL